MGERQRRELADIEELKALAHPLRQQLLTRLQRQGPATSAVLAHELGVDRGATSYHLRQLARFGFIEEDTARSAGRRRFWRAVAQDVRLPRRGARSGIDTAADQIGRLWKERAERDLDAFLSDPDRFGELGAVAMHSFGSTTLNAEELAAFGEEYIAFVNRWHREPTHASPGSRHVSVVFHAFPTPDDTTATPDDRAPT